MVIKPFAPRAVLKSLPLALAQGSTVGKDLNTALGIGLNCLNSMNNSTSGWNNHPLCSTGRTCLERSCPRTMSSVVGSTLWRQVDVMCIL